METKVLRVLGERCEAEKQAEAWITLNEMLQKLRKMKRNNERKMFFFVDIFVC